MRRRAQDILAEAKLAQAQAERERARGQRDSAGMAGWANLAQQGISALGNAIPGAVDKISEGASSRLSQDLILKNQGITGEKAEQRIASKLPLGLEGPEEDPSTPRERDPFAPTKYKETSAELARRLVGSDPSAKGDPGFFGGLDRDIKSKAALAAQAQLVKEIESRRDAEGAQDRESAKWSLDRDDKRKDFDLKSKKMLQDEEHFGLTQKQQRELAATSRSFQSGETQKGREFTAAENTKNRAAAQERATTMAGQKDEGRVVSDPTSLKLAGFKFLVNQFNQIGVRSDKLPDGSFGRLSGIEAAAERAINLDDSARTALSEKLARIWAKKLNIQSGQSVTPEEERKFAKSVAQLSQNKETFSVLLHDIMDEAVDEHNTMLSTLNDAGYNVRNLRPMAGPSPPADDAAAIEDLWTRQ